MSNTNNPENKQNKPFSKEDFIRALKYEILMDFLEWMNKVAIEDPMALETDNEDIIEMYLNKTYG